MRCVSKKNSSAFDADIFHKAEKKYNICIRDEIKTFVEKNAGGYPLKSIIECDDEEYEVRVFLSADRADRYYCIEKPLDFFLSKTKGKIIPIAIDSGDNYYCVNNETGKIYYWSSDLDEYYYIVQDLHSFCALFE